MAKRILTLFIVTALACASAQAQQRVKKKSAEDFDAIYKSLGEAWGTGAYGKATSAARDLLKLIGIKRSEAILAAFPPAPEGFSIVAQRKKNNASNNPLAAAIGTVIKQRYKPDAGGRNLEVIVTADSPMAQMFKMWITNPAALGPVAELVKYNEYDAVLKKERNGWNLQILIDKDVAKIAHPDTEARFAV